MSRMMKEIPKADVVITNPTHFAVAIKYDTRKLEIENSKLQLDLRKARERKIKHEYKKVSDIGGKK